MRFLDIFFLFLTAVLFTGLYPVTARSEEPLPDEVMAGVDHLFDLVGDSSVLVDKNRIGTVMDFILTDDGSTEYVPDDREGGNGAYTSYKINVDLPTLVKYTYNPDIPAVLMRPASTRSSIWLSVNGKQQPIPQLWKDLETLPKPFLLRGVQRESNTPDLNSGAYYQYDLDRLIILSEHKGRLFLMSVSKQRQKSEVGRKGAIVGKDSDWVYLYSKEKGTTMGGLGWADSYIYDFLSICVYIQDGDGRVKNGIFQWIKAGWSGFNLVKTKHIQKGFKRFADNYKAILESPLLPDVSDFKQMYKDLNTMEEEKLRRQASPLFEVVKEQVVGDKWMRKKGFSELVQNGYFQNLPKDSIVRMMMVEYLKHRLGKDTLVDQDQWVALLREGPKDQ